MRYKGCEGCKAEVGRPDGRYSTSKEQPVQKWRGVDGVASSRRVALITSNCGMPKESSGHRARLKGPESDLGVGT